MKSPVEEFTKLIPVEKLAPAVVAFLRTTSAPVAVACSGGSDSVAAALLVKAILGERVPLTLLHFNHRLRGRHAEKDAEFVRQLAKDIGAGFRLGEWAHPNKQNELAAREARMEFLHQWEHEAIVFGHHADDAVESLLMRLARGSGLQGLCAPHEINRVGRHLHLRPLLTLRKAEIGAALKACKIKFRHDASNDGGDYLRNRIRNKLLPLWQKIETRDVAEGVLRSQQQLKELYNKKECQEGNVRNAVPTPTEHDCGCDLSQKNILKSRRDGSSNSPAFQGRARDEGEQTPTPFSTSHLPFPVSHPLSSTSLPLGATLLLPSGATLTAQRVRAPTLKELKESSDPRTHVWIKDTSITPGERNSSPLSVRPWRAGERYAPLGTGRRKIKEILNETCGDVSPELRACWPVVVNSNDEPLWLPGARITQAAALTGEDKFAVELKFENGTHR